MVARFERVRKTSPKAVNFIFTCRGGYHPPVFIDEENLHQRRISFCAGARWDAPTVGENEAHLRCMKNEAGLRPVKRGFAARRVNEYASFYVRPVGEFCLKVKRFSPLSRAEFHPSGEIPVGF